MPSLVTPEYVLKHLKEKGYPILSEWYCTPNFRWRELLVNQNEIPTIEILNNLLKIAQILEVYRKKVFNNSPITITSGWRSVAYNKKIGGAGKSNHVFGKALDFTVKDFTPEQIYILLDPFHLGGIERTGGNWSHIDLRNNAIRFTPQGNILASKFSIEAHDKLFKKG